jgi:hypothetical protein
MKDSILYIPRSDIYSFVGAVEQDAEKFFLEIYMHLCGFAYGICKREKKK